MRGKRLAGLIIALTLLIGGSAYAYQLTVESVVEVLFDGSRIDCGRIDDGFGGGNLLCLNSVDAREGQRELAGAAALIGAMVLFGIWRTRFDGDDRIPGAHITLRTARPTDRGAVGNTMSEAIIDEHGWTGHETRRFLEVLGIRTFGNVYVVEPIAPSPHEGKVVGCMMATPGPDGAWWIGGWVGEPWQQLGFGTDAAVAITTWLFDQGIRNVHAECSADNLAVRSMLEHIGFANMGEIRTRLPNDRLERAVRYAKHTPLPRGYEGYRLRSDERSH